MNNFSYFILCFGPEMKKNILEVASSSAAPMSCCCCDDGSCLIIVLVFDG
jgi:hypothetical protein